MNAATALTLSSSAFSSNKPIPVIYTCEGRDQIPDLSWGGIPANTQSFTLLMQDPDAASGNWVHWIVFNIPAIVRQWNPADFNLPAGVKFGKNSWGSMDYRGPCPPFGKDHHYIFTLYALDSLLELPDGANAQQVLDALKGHILEKAELIGIYHRSH